MTTKKLEIYVAGGVILGILALIISINPEVKYDGILDIPNHSLIFKNESVGDLTVFISLKDVNKITQNTTEHYYLVILNNTKSSIDSKLQKVEKKDITTERTGLQGDIKIYEVIDFSERNGYEGDDNTSYLRVYYKEVKDFDLPKKVSKMYLIRLDTENWVEDQFNITIAGAFLDPEIGACGTMTAQGTYTLNTSIDNDAGNCMVFGNDSIIFDCNGFYIDGDDSGETDLGISVYQDDNITIRNCLYVQQFAKNIQVRDSTNTVIENTTVRDSYGTGFYGAGISFFGTSANLTIDSVISHSNSNTGIIIQDVTSPGTITIKDSTIYSNSLFGILADEVLTIQNNTLYDSNISIYLNDDSDGSTVTNNTLSNSTTGIYLNASDMTAVGNTLINISSIYLYTSDTTNSTYTDTTLGYDSINKINWNGSISTNETNLIEGSTIYSQRYWTSLNDSANDPFNTTAIVYMESRACANQSVYVKTGFPVTLLDILANGSVHTTVNCTSNETNFTVTGFSGYAMASGNVTYTIDYADPNDILNLSCFEAYMNSSEPEYQDYDTPAVNLTSIIDTASIYNITLKINDSLSTLNGTVLLFTYPSHLRPANQTQNWSNTGNGIVNIPIEVTNSTTVILRRIKASSNVGLWFWMDCVNITDNQSMNFSMTWGGGVE